MKIIFMLVLCFGLALAMTVAVEIGESGRGVIITAPSISINYSLVPTVNSSDYWDYLDTPSDISGSIYWYNQSLVSEAWVVAQNYITTQTNIFDQELNRSYPVEFDELNVSDINRNYGNLVLFNGSDIGNTVEGYHVIVYRRAAEGDGYIEWYISQYEDAYVNFRGDTNEIFQFSSTAGPIIFYPAYGKDLEMTRYGPNNIKFAPEMPSDRDVIIELYGYSGGAKRYVSWQVDESTDTMMFSRDSITIQEYAMNSPLHITTDSSDAQVALKIEQPDVDQPFIDFQGELGDSGSANIYAYTNTNGKYLTYVTVTNATDDVDTGALAVYELPPIASFGLQYESPNYREVDIQINEDGIEILKEMLDDEVYHYSVKVPIVYNNLGLVERKRLGFPTTKKIWVDHEKDEWDDDKNELVRVMEKGVEEVNLTTEEAYSYTENYYFHITPEEWTTAVSQRDLILEKANEKLEFRKDFLKQISKEVIDFKSLR